MDILKGFTKMLNIPSRVLILIMCSCCAHEDINGWKTSIPSIIMLSLNPVDQCSMAQIAPAKS